MKQSPLPGFRSFGSIDLVTSNPSGMYLGTTTSTHTWRPVYGGSFHGDSYKVQEVWMEGYTKDGIEYPPSLIDAVASTSLKDACDQIFEPEDGSHSYLSPFFDAENLTLHGYPLFLKDADPRHETGKLSTKEIEDMWGTYTETDLKEHTTPI